MKKVIAHNSVNTGNSNQVIPRLGGKTSPHIDNLFNVPVGFLELLDEIAIGVVILDFDRKIVPDFEFGYNIFVAHDDRFVVHRCPGTVIIMTVTDRTVWA